MYSHSSQIRVRYGETDQMGVVYYGNYALYFEVGRTEAMRALGHSYESLEAEGIAMPVVQLESRYIKSARYDDVLSITTSIKELPKASIRFYYDTYNQKGELINTGSTTLAFFDNARGRITKCPKRLLAALEEHIN